MNIRDIIKDYPDYPKQGIVFKDMWPVIDNPDAFQYILEEFEREFRGKIDTVIGIESRGFLFATALSYAFGGGVVMCRKAGKLPNPTANYSYQTEYSNDELSIHFGKGKVVIVDDVLATGGTMLATNYLCKTAGYDVVDHLVLIDLKYIPLTEQSTHLGKFNLEVKSLIQYE